MNHEEIRQLISQDYDGEATEKEQALIAEHVKDCAACRAYQKSLNKLSTILESWDDETQVPDSMEQALQGAIKAAAPRRKEEPKMKPKNRLFAYGVRGGVLVTLLVAVMVVMQGEKNLKRLKTIQQDGSAVQYEPYYLDIGRTEAQYAPRAGSVQRLAKKEARQETSFQFAASSDQAVRASAGFKAMSLDPRTFDEIERDVALGLVPFEPWTERPGLVVDHNTEEYTRIKEKPFVSSLDEPLSTFSIDVDTASYANIRRVLNAGQMPSRDMVRAEEMINYFDYDYPRPQGKDPFSITIKGASAPWNPDHDLVMVGLQGKTLASEELPPSNLVFLIDVSGSMSSAEKLPLLKQGFKMMVNQLGPDERIAIVTYAGSAGTVLESTPGDHKAEILAALDRLRSGGSTAGGAGIKAAYRIAKEHFIEGGNNRVILATDGDFNIGVSDTAQLTRLIEEKRRDGIFLSILGFGTGNYKDGRMEELSNKGNGNYYYIDTLKEARKVLVSELGSTLFTIAKDVKIQVEFNPGKVKAYRLIGYENRALAKQDFNDDTKDAGELGAGHSVTALYEIIPADSREEIAGVDELKYQAARVVESPELMTVKLRYKEPDGDVSKLLSRAVNADHIAEQPSGDFAFAAAVAEFSLLLRRSEYKANASYARVLKAARAAKGADTNGYRQEFIELVEKASILDAQTGEGIQFK